MKDRMFEADIDDFDSDVDTPDLDWVYRIINAPVPTLPRVQLPRLGMPDFNLQWRRLKNHWRTIRRRKWLLVAVIGGVLATLCGFGQFLFSYFQF